MIIVYNQYHYLHNPPYELFEGVKVSNPELPVRAENILKTLRENHFMIKQTTIKVPKSLLERVHDREYLTFLSNFNLEETKFPSIFPKRVSRKLTNPKILFGFHSLDTYTPILKGTFKAAFWSASTAYEAAIRLQRRDDRAIYALCRPPGHHAEESQMGGYCYLNNTAIAAEYLSAYGKVAILDLDFHHGNGTQSIFYQRSDVLYASIHADPNQKFPHFSGFIDEKGMGKGRGFNINRPLKLGTNNQEYNQVLEEVLSLVDDFKANFLIVSLGIDTHKDDPISGFTLTSAYFRKMGCVIANLNLPTLIVQEGGYNPQALAKGVEGFLKGFRMLNI